jgi:hypothetical protein
MNMLMDSANSNDTTLDCGRRIGGALLGLAMLAAGCGDLQPTGLESDEEYGSDEDATQAEPIEAGLPEAGELSTSSGLSTSSVISPSSGSTGASRPFRIGNVLLQSTEFNALNWWMISGESLVSSTYGGAPSRDWTVKGVGDFNGDLQEDILWRHTNGQVSIWFMVSAGTIRFVTYPGGTDPDGLWSIQGVGDFNGNGRADILWRDTSGYLAIWFDGNYLDTAAPSYGDVPAPVDLSWQVNGVGDFDGDRHADILWRHTDGQVAIWYMSGGRRVGEGYPGGRDPSGIFSIQGTGDFDGDGRSDILWRDTTGNLAIWSHGDRYSDTYPSYRNAGGTVDLSWSIKGIGDFNADGRSDLLWTHSSGSVAIWFMAGGMFSGDAYPTTLASGWEIRAVRGSHF